MTDKQFTAHCARIDAKMERLRELTAEQIEVESLNGKVVPHATAVRLLAVRDAMGGVRK